MFLTIDFEASCLPRHGRSFPIEVGIAGPGIARSWLIRPHAQWADWDWTQEAEQLHRLRRVYVEWAGLPAEVVMAELTEAVAGHRVVADSRIDQYWLETLARASGRAVPFAIDHVADLFDEAGADESRIVSAVAIADARYQTRHRAGTDAQWLYCVLEQVTGMPIRHAASPIPYLMGA